MTVAQGRKAGRQAGRQQSRQDDGGGGQRGGQTIEGDGGDGVWRVWCSRPM